MIKQYFRYVSANVLGMVGISCYILADTFFIAQGVGADGLTALNLAIPVFNLINGLGLMLGMGGATRFAIAGGKGEKQERREIFAHTFYLLCILSVLFVVGAVFFAPSIALWLGADSATKKMTTDYLRILMVFTPFFMCNNLLNCFVRNDGSPALSMAAMLAGSFFNIVFDYILVFPLHLGIQGAAMATAASPIVSICILSVHIFRKKNHFHFSLLKPRLKPWKDVCALGSTSLLVEISSGIVMLVFNLLILNIQGNIGVAAYGVVANIAMVLNAIYTGISQGMQPLVSRSYGKGDKRVSFQVLRYAMITAVCFAVFSYVILFLAANPIIAVFNKEKSPLLAEIAKRGMEIYFASFLFGGINIITAAFFSAMARPQFAFVITMLRGIVFVIPLAFLLSSLLGLTGIWLTMPMTEAVVMVLAIILQVGLKRKSGVEEIV